jgi:hypothetical protein
VGIDELGFGHGAQILAEHESCKAPDMKQSGRRSKSGNASGSRVREATGGHKQRPGASGGKHPKNKIFTGGKPPRRLRHPHAKA